MPESDAATGSNFPDAGHVFTSLLPAEVADASGSHNDRLGSRRVAALGSARRRAVSAGLRRLTRGCGDHCGPAIPRVAGGMNAFTTSASGVIGTSILSELLMGVQPLIVFSMFAVALFGCSRQDHLPLSSAPTDAHIMVMSTDGCAGLRQRADQSSFHVHFRLLK